MEENRREREIANLRAEARRLRDQLALLSRLGTRLTGSIGSDVLEDIIESACELTEARYGAIGTFNAEGHIETFITYGISTEQRDAIGNLPEGLGILGLMRDLNEPLRLSDLTRHVRSVGFPPNHPPMKTFLGTPLRFVDETLGNIYLTEKAGGQEFTAEDERLLVLFASQAATAIRTAQLHSNAQAVAVLEERDRIGMGLHDGVIQSLYGTGLRLESAIEDLGIDADAARASLETAVTELNQVIADVRSYVLQLRPEVLAGKTLTEALAELTDHLRLNENLVLELEESAGAGAELNDVQVMELYLIGQEALGNARRHASASRVTTRLLRHDDTFVMRIEDDGQGFDPSASNPGSGLRNIRERARKLGGTVEVDSQLGKGTTIEVRIPVRGRPLGQRAD